MPKDFSIIYERARRGLAVQSSDILALYEAYEEEKEKSTPKPITLAPMNGTPVIMMRKGCQSEVGYFRHSDGYKAWFAVADVPKDFTRNNWHSKPPTHFLYLEELENDDDLA